MSYYITTQTTMSFEKALERAVDELKKEGFGVITTIDVKETLKKKIDVDFRKYLILGACNPVYAHRALSMDDKIGALLPCNIILQEKENGTEVSAINPYESMKGILDKDVVELSKQITDKLSSIIRNI
ncbi:MAG: hypothetical protein AMS27_14665 [Bacteroides sp. SM23_62_1]|nr:MAG: hypothetical protein AMS27_14665 [Bacteroides sp. SM23_62_1]